MCRAGKEAGGDEGGGGAWRVGNSATIILIEWTNCVMALKLYFSIMVSLHQDFPYQ